MTRRPRTSSAEIPPVYKYLTVANILYRKSKVKILKNYLKFTMNLKPGVPVSH